MVYIISSDFNEREKAVCYQLVKQLAEKENVTEKLKAEQPMKWVGKINALREAAAEIVNAEVIFA